MRLVLTIAGREARSLAASSVAHVAAALVLAVFGLFFTSELSGLTEARLDGWFESGAVVLLILAPVLAMHSLAEERRSGSIDVLLAGPVSDADLVVGKFLGLALVYVGILAATLPALVLVSLWGDPDPGPVLTGYAGLLLLGLASLALALLASALSPHQAVAAVTGFVALLVLWLLAGISRSFAGSAGEVLLQLGSTTHLEPFYRGLVPLDAVVYFASVTVVGLLGAVLVLGVRRWR
ncbi:MAG: transporter [Actinomycetia bacterium]|nr:transporter [Actinomycetes bacterium]